LAQETVSSIASAIVKPESHAADDQIYDLASKMMIDGSDKTSVSLDSGASAAEDTSLVANKDKINMIA